VLLAVVFLLAGCHEPGKPRMRFGSYFGELGGMEFPDPKALGKQNYQRVGGEVNGMLYTCKGGFIDLGHVREGADRAAYLTRLTYRNLVRKQTEFSFHFIEPSMYKVKIAYPPGWSNLEAIEKEKVLKNVSAHVGQYLAHTMMIWHEILTWNGWTSTVLFSEKPSAFSWEDSYSDVLGTSIGAKAAFESARNYGAAAAKLLYQAMDELDVQPSETARKATKRIHGQWYSGKTYPFVQMKRHNFDVGLDDGTIMPMLVPEICPGTVAEPYPVPRADVLRENGFNIEVGIDPRVKKTKIHNLIGLDEKSLIVPETHFPMIMTHIETEDREPMTEKNEFSKFQHLRRQ